MNRFPTWKYALIALTVVAAFLYTLPNFFGESPAVQVSSARSTVNVDAALLARVEDALAKENIGYTGVVTDTNGIRIRFADTDTQLRAKDAIQRALNGSSGEDTYVVALNLLPASPNWLTAIHAMPMYLGLDLRGGVHFLLQVDTKAAVAKRIDNIVGDLRTGLREKNVRYGGITRQGDRL